MAHFAKLDPNTNTVLDVVYVDNELLQDENGVEREHIGADKLEAANPGFTFKQTSYNTEANEHRAEGEAHLSERIMLQMVVSMMKQRCFCCRTLVR